MKHRNRRSTRTALALLAFALAAPELAFADVPTHYEQFIYSIAAYNGRDYSGTFVRQPVGTLYLIANSDNFVSARSTMVYFWPITGDYRLDTTTLDHQFGGTLRITGSGVDEALHMESYTYYNLRGEYELNWLVAKGAQAEKVYASYRKLIDQYRNAVLAYQKAQGNYQERLRQLADEITAQRARGNDTSKLIDKLRSLKQPAPPNAPTEYSSPPITPQKAFVINLPVGVYHLWLKNPDGTAMQGSEKRLVVFTSRGAQKVGYDVIPGDKWTRPETSEVPGSVLYVDGTTDLFLRPFFEKQYNDLYHGKLVNNDARGNPNISSWVKLQQVPGALVNLTVNGATRTEKQESFSVQQLPGRSLGYKIVPWAQAHHQPGARPDIVAYRVPLSRNQRVIYVAALDSTGQVLDGSEREIRIVTGNVRQLLLFVFVLLPLFTGGVVMVIRSRRYGTKTGL